MTVLMRHSVTGGEFEAQEAQIPILLRSGWAPANRPEMAQPPAEPLPQTESGTVWLYHDDTGAEFEAQPAQVEGLKLSGWTISDKSRDARKARLAELEAEAKQLRAAEAAADARERATADKDAEVGESRDKGPTVDELKEQLRELGQPVSGTKQELTERIEAARAEQAGDENETREQ